MTPYSLTSVGNTEIFHYRFAELREFILQGRETGNVGLILIRRDYTSDTVRGFGTIESPRTHLCTFIFKRNDVFGSRPAAHDIIHPQDNLFPYLGFVYPTTNAIHGPSPANKGI